MKIGVILDWLDSQKYKFEFAGERNAEIEGFSSLDSYIDNTITWIKKEKNYDVCGRPVEIACAVVQNDVKVDCKNVIRTDVSKEIFFSILHQFWGEKQAEGGIGEGTIVSQEAVIDSTASIGCNCSIVGSVVIGAHTIIEHNVVIQGSVRIGENCYIQSGAVIGEAGFGYYKTSDGHSKQVPHMGGVVINDYVEIGANTCIDRGTIGDTIIGEHTKIDNLVHIAHNVQIGKDVLIIAGAVLGGSSRIQDRAYIAPGAVVRNQITVAKDSFIGMQACVVKDTEEDTTVMGVPAKQKI